MEQLDRLFHQLVPLCESCINPLVVVYCFQKVAVGIMVTYIGVGGKLGENDELLHLFFQLFALAFYKDAYECFAGPLTVVTATENLLKEVNQLRTVVPVKQLVEVEHVVAYLKDQNAFAGPGYMVAGQLITKRLLWNICASAMAVLAGTFASSI